jgi:hypothetical protein
LQSKGIDGLDEPPERIEDMAEFYLHALKELQSRGRPGTNLIAIFSAPEIAIMNGQTPNRVVEPWYRWGQTEGNDR